MITKLTSQKVYGVLRKRFGGVIKSGQHKEKSGECCVLELGSAMHCLEWTDDPYKVGAFDIRDLNDIDVSDELRTKWMVKLFLAYDGSYNWSQLKKERVLRKIIVLTIQCILGELPDKYISKRHQSLKEQFRAVKNFAAAANVISKATRLRYIEELRMAIWILRCNHYVMSSQDIARVVHNFTKKMNQSDRNKTFVKACKIWLEAAA